MTLVNLDEEIKLTTNNRERAQMDNMADLYSIIVVLEHLEMAYIRSAITHTQYTPECRQLIAQFKTASSLLGDVVPDLEKFMKEYNLDCPAAAKRIKIGVPATVEFGDGGASNEPSGHKSAKYIAETVQSYITVMDMLKLGMGAVDEIHPHLADLMQSLNNVRSLPADFEGRAKLREWLIKLNGMRASEELAADEKRQMEFDLESNYTAFRGWLDSQ
ncbi:vacuolar protein sorting-associated [Gamsiella multidivaricata]|uniref:vacuolar protein sorting-associated n=1 Tax=Gamsiella multidivaricata TaxID=101098 RepID=UPI00221E8CA0|nr:vacuolar protein sorting-associated [Gamsiella multidivaricata]KAI7828642.1 vacuolar protein sorting-associated [Gamsiella multidivaricata]